MACTCTQDFVDVGNGVTIGVNKITCAECLAQTQIQQNNNRKQEILVELKQLDEKSARCMRDIILGNGDIVSEIAGIQQTPNQYLTSLESQAATLRSEYSSL